MLRSSVASPVWGEPLPRFKRIVTAPVRCDLVVASR
jgi:hypothetical protein